MTVPAVLGFWAHRTFLDTDNYVDTVAAISTEPEVRAAVARKVSQAVAQNVDYGAAVDEALGSRPNAARQEVAARLREAVPAVAERATAELLASQRVGAMWADAHRSMHAQLLAALSGEQEGPLQLVDGQLVLDITPIVDEVRSELARRGFGQAADATVPPDDRRIVVAEAAELAQVQQLYRIAAPLSRWLLVIAALLYLGAILLARRRALMIAITGVAVVVCGSALLLAVLGGQGAVPQRFSDPQFQAAAGDVYMAVTGWLRTASYLMLAIGAVLAAAVPVVVRWRAGRAGSAQGEADEHKVPVGA